MLRPRIISCCLLLMTVCALGENPPRPHAREVGVQLGVIPPGPLNAITDVAGVLVGQTTVSSGENFRTGVTAILPHSGNLFGEKVPGAVFVGNAFGKLTGSTQVNELGEIETPILLTSTLSVPRLANAVIHYMLALPGNENVQSINPWLAKPTMAISMTFARGRSLAKMYLLLYRAQRQGPWRKARWARHERKDDFAGTWLHDGIWGPFQ